MSLFSSFFSPLWTDLVPNQSNNPAWYVNGDRGHWAKYIQTFTPQFLQVLEVLLVSVWDFPGGSEGKASAFNAGDLGSIPGWGRYPGEGNGNPLQYSCLDNPMDVEAWWATVPGLTKSRT